MLQVLEQSSAIDEGRRVLQVEASAISDLIARLDQRFAEAVTRCFSCAGHIVVIGMGKSGLIGKKIAATFASTGTPSFFLHPAEAIHGDLGMVAKDDVALLLSNSGETEELLRLLPSLKRLGLPLIAMTGNGKSTLAKLGDVSLDVSVKEEACPLGLAPTASTTAMLAMGDALAVALLQKRGFRSEDFASFHPGGHLGQRLLLRVADVMHTGASIPVVTEETPMSDVVIEMTEKKLGMTTVVNAQRFSGIITDGDLRRLIKNASANLNAVFSRSASEVMNPSPKTIPAHTLAAEAIHIMESHSITVLVVTNAGGQLEGVVHLHDLLKKGVV